MNVNENIKEERDLTGFWFTTLLFLYYDNVAECPVLC